MARKEFWRINATSTLIGESKGFTVALTGGWYDVYFTGVHVYGTLNLATAFGYLT